MTYVDPPRLILTFTGGPLDGARVEGVERAYDEIILRTTEYYPRQPAEVVYRRVATLPTKEIVQETIRTGCRCVAYVQAPESALVERVRNQDTWLKQAQDGLNELLAKYQRQQAREAARKKRAKK
jgi:hypothetical protein